jgi:hypothetical protein
MSGAAAVHHHPGIRAHAVQDAIFDEMAGLVQHAGIGRFAGIDLGDVARGRVIQHGEACGPTRCNFFRPDTSIKPALVRMAT